ncbi:ferredoxin [Streptomyces sp. NPDC093224]|uniref:ferredoxin n=1 Tax=Streptomyces sp. NPDC093224 TaxID=3155198 RepID=UPI00341A07EE
MTPYWDPMPTVRTCEEGRPLPGLAEWVPAYNHSWDTWPDAWQERNWRNVPGPFYGAATDTCWVGRGVAPDHILYDDEYGLEFVYRQPRTPEETYRVMAAAWQDPMAGFACDGDERWTPELVREWWRDRGRVREWAAALERNWSVSDREAEREAACGARAYVAYIDDGLAEHLRGYLFWLTEHRTPAPGAPLPNL